ncbi:MAG: serine/threonine-protein kinase, partial [Acidobacteriota bacterium]
RGAGDYLAKPFECEEIVFRLSRLLPADRPQSASETQLGRLVRTGDLTSPAAVDRYEAHRVVGRGAMGVVLAGVDPRLERQVAIKILDPVTYRPQRESGQHHALHEGSALARFDHPNIVKIYDTGMAEGLPFLVMELVDGESLATRLERGPLELRPAVNLARAVARALETAHGDGWLHRDIKPANILLASGGAIKVTDFGLASLADDAEESGGERIFGTPGYTPPECLIGDPHTRHGDLFALGSVLYFCLCGRSPFAAATLPARLAATLAGRYQPLPDEIPRPLRKLIDQLLASDPSKRPESARGVARRLEWIAEALAVPDLPNEDLEPAETLPVQIH